MAGAFPFGPKPEPPRLRAMMIGALLVPSLMQLLGRWNWWAPGALRRLHALIGFGET